MDLFVNMLIILAKGTVLESCYLYKIDIYKDISSLFKRLILNTPVIHGMSSVITKMGMNEVFGVNSILFLIYVLIIWMRSVCKILANCTLYFVFYCALILYLNKIILFKKYIYFFTFWEIFLATNLFPTDILTCLHSSSHLSIHSFNIYFIQYLLCLPDICEKTGTREKSVHCLLRAYILLEMNYTIK